MSKNLKNTIKIQCPAKINLTLKVTGKRPDGFHNIESIMQTISLYDYLTIKAEPSEKTEIILSGNSEEIPYNEKNLVYKAVEKFPMSPHKIEIYIEKNIPVSAGLAGGSTNCAGAIFGLNELFGQPLTREELHKLCAQLGSDINFCLEGGRQMTKGRGEILEPLEFEDFNVSLIKPENLGISAKEAYTKFSQKKAMGKDSGEYLNDLEWAVIDDYKELQAIKNSYPNSMMSGSGSTYFVIGEEFAKQKGYWISNNLNAIPYGVKQIPL
jgi:4-diphosphocytidyl-2-C-methyl-D-erythritol kinase